MARQIKSPPTQGSAEVRVEAARSTQPPKERPAVEGIMALPPEDFDKWRRSIGLRTLSELAPDER